MDAKVERILSDGNLTRSFVAPVFVLSASLRSVLLHEDQPEKPTLNFE